MKLNNEMPLAPTRENREFIKDLQKPSDFNISWKSEFASGNICRTGAKFNEKE